MRLLAVVALLVGVLVAAPSRLDARSCIVGLSNDQHLETSSAVFLGQVVGQRVVRDGRGDTEVETTFAVESQFKGEPVQRAVVRTCGGDGMMCPNSFVFEPEQWYVVFAWGSPLRTTNCSLTSTREAGSPVLAWLRERQHKGLANQRMQPAAVGRCGIMRGADAPRLMRGR